jgi:DNA-binding NarL/FixJ family response regulator
MRVVVVGMEAHPAFVSRLSGRGAAAYVLKDRLDEDLLRELRPAEGTGGHHERPAA